MRIMNGVQPTISARPCIHREGYRMQQDVMCHLTASEQNKAAARRSFTGHSIPAPPSQILEFWICSSELCTVHRAKRWVEER
jgi:hypothetical protein